MKIADFQRQMKDVYLKRDKEKGIETVFVRLMEEMGELDIALKDESVRQIADELADVIAWAFSIANIYEIDVAKALKEKYRSGCSKCDTIPCSCEKY